MSRFSTLIGGALALLYLALSPAQAETPVPNVIRIVFPFAAGGSGDALSRIIAAKMDATLHCTVIVEDRTGAAGRIGARDVAKAAPDGATLLLTPIAPVSIYQHVYTSLSYDPIKDFAPVSQVGTFDFGIAVGPMADVKTLKDLVAWAKANPDKTNYGIPAAGSLPHFLGVMFGRAADIKMVTVAYRGSAAAVADVIAGHIPMAVSTTSDFVQMHKAGRIRILATSGKERSSFVPEVPTFREAGYDLVASGWYAVFAPAKTPADLIDRYSKAIAEAVKDPDVKKNMEAFGLNPTGTTAAELGKIQQADSDTWAPAVKASGFTAKE